MKAVSIQRILSNYYQQKQYKDEAICTLDEIHALRRSVT